MTVVVGTAGHIDHGKTALLRVLTGIDADRLPEERRRGMTLDVGYAHLVLNGGATLDFVDVPGHERLVGNMLVGAGEIDAALLVVAADDGPRAQTFEHLALLDALGIRDGIVVITKIDAVPDARWVEVATEAATLVGRSGLRDAPVVAASSVTGEGLDALRAALERLRLRVEASRPAGGGGAPRLAVDRLFTVKGRGAVVTGTLRGGELRRGDVLRAVPGGASVRIREIQVHGSPLEIVTGGGRAALNIVVDGEAVRRGTVLTADPGVVATDRVLVGATGELRDRARFRLHIGTDAVEATVGRAGRDALDLGQGAVGAILRLDAPVGCAPGDRFVLRRATPATIVGGVVLDPAPARGVSRRRQTPDRVAALADAVASRDPERVALARTALHGVAGEHLAPDVRVAVHDAAIRAVAADHVANPTGPGPTLAAVRGVAARALRRVATVRADDAGTFAAREIATLVADRELVQDGSTLRAPGHQPPVADAGLVQAMARLERSLACLAPPRLSVAAAEAGCRRRVSATSSGPRASPSLRPTWPTRCPRTASWRPRRCGSRGGRP